MWFIQLIISLRWPLNFLTKEMEGDGPTGALMLANYFQMIKDLKKKEAAGA